MADTSNAAPVLPERSMAYAGALEKSLKFFTSHTQKTIDEIMSNGLRPVADAADVDRIVVLRVVNKTKAQFGEILRWEKREGVKVLLDENLKVLPENKLFSQWLSDANENDCINFPIKDLSREELAFLGPFGIKSILAIPVFAFDELWGVFTFQDHLKERNFDEESTRLLRSLACLCASTIMREEQRLAEGKAGEAHKRRKILAETIHETAILFLSQSNKPFREMMNQGVLPIMDLVGIDRFSIFQNFKRPDGLHSSQVYRWERDAGGTTAPNKAYTNVTFEQCAPMWEYLFAEGKVENGPVRLMSEKEAEMLKSVGVVSAYVTPLFINYNFWGVALFEDHHNERYFDDEYAEMMRSLGFFCASTILRAEMDQRIRKAEILRKDQENDMKYKAMAHWYQSLLDTMPFIVIAQDMDENCTFMNEFAEMALEKNRSDMVGKPCRNIGVEICGTDKCAISCAKRGRMRTRFSHKNVNYQVDTKIVKDINGKAVGYIEVIQDITEDE